MFHKNKQTKQIIFGVFIFLVAIGGLFAGEYLVEGFLHKNPLQKKVEAIKEITDYTITENKSTGEINLVISLTEVDNLQETVEPFIKEVERIKGRRVSGVEVKSPSASKLQDTYYELSFALEEARISGQYQRLFANLQEMEREEGGRFRVYIGEQFLFVQLAKGADFYYTVLSRGLHVVNFGASAVEGGGV